MKMSFTVTYQDGRTFNLAAGPRDFVNYERQFSTSLAKLNDSPTMESIYYLAWSALHRAGDEPGDFDSFLEVVDDVEPVEGEDADPTSADSSAPSAS